MQIPEKEKVASTKRDRPGWKGGAYPNFDQEKTPVLSPTTAQFQEG